MGFGWEGRLVRLVPIEHERHFENCYRWINDPEVTEWLLVGDFPIAKLAQEEWFEKASKPSETNIIFAIETLEGEHIGNSGVHHIDLRNGTCTTGSLIGRKDVWGHGYGTDAARVRAKYCFEVLGLRYIYSGYLDGNERSRKMSANVGLTECGRYPKKIWKRGQYRDEVLLSLDRESWLKNL